MITALYGVMITVLYCHHNCIVLGHDNCIVLGHDTCIAMLLVLNASLSDDPDVFVKVLSCSCFIARSALCCFAHKSVTVK